MSFLLSGFLPEEGGAASSENDVITSLRLVPPTYMYMYIGNGEKEEEGQREGEDFYKAKLPTNFCCKQHAPLPVQRLGPWDSF
jgi:hypothetical protein